VEKLVRRLIYIQVRKDLNSGYEEKAEGRQVQRDCIINEKGRGI
jgi:hypothetical protein